MSNGSKTNVIRSENHQNAEWFVKSGIFDRDLEQHSIRTSIQKDDLAQLVALSILESKNQPEDKNRRAWVQTIIRRRAIDYIRQQSRKRELQSDWEIVQPTETDKNSLKWHAFKKCLVQVIADNPDLSELLRFWWHAPSLKEHAKLMGISIPKVRRLRDTFRTQARKIMARLVSDHN